MGWPHWAEGARGSALCHSKTAIILQWVAGKGHTADQIFTMENTHAIIPDLMGLTSQKVSAKCSRLELTTLLAVTLEELVNIAASKAGRNMCGGNSVHLGLSTQWKGYD